MKDANNKAEHTKAARFPWPEGEKATKLLTRRVEVCSERGDRAWDLLVWFQGCGCGWLSPDLGFEERIGQGAERPEDLVRPLRGPLTDDVQRLDVCPQCGRELDPDRSMQKSLFIHSAGRKADLVVSWADGRALFHLWSHRDGTVQPLDETMAQSPTGRDLSDLDLDAFIVASSFRRALGQVRFDEPQEPPALRTCLRRNPDFLPAVELTAQIRMAQGRYRDAAALLRRVVRESPGKVEAWYALGLCLTESFRSAPPNDKPELAEQAVRCLLEAEERSLSPNAAHYRALGAVLLMAGQDEAAAQQLETALTLEPNHSDTLLHLGMARLRCHRPEEARDLLEKAISDRPADPVAGLWLAESLIDLGDNERAERELERCRALGAPTKRIAALENRISPRGTNS